MSWLINPYRFGTSVNLTAQVNTPVAFGAIVTNINVPYPGDIIAGDLLICFLAARAGVITAPSGFTEVDQQFSADTANNGEACTQLSWKIAAGTETGTVNATRTGSSQFHGMICRVRRMSGSSPALVGSSKALISTAANDLETGSITPSGTGHIIAAVVAHGGLQSSIINSVTAANYSAPDTLRLMPNTAPYNVNPTGWEQVFFASSNFGDDMTSGGFLLGDRSITGATGALTFSRSILTKGSIVAGVFAI